MLEGGGGEGRLRLEWEECKALSDSDSLGGNLVGVAKLKRLQAVVEAVSATGLAALFTHNLEWLRGAFYPEAGSER